MFPKIGYLQTRGFLIIDLPIQCKRRQEIPGTPWRALLVNGQSTDYSNPQEGRKVKLHYFRGEFTSLVGGLNPSEKYESVGMISNPIYGKIKNVPNHQPAEND